MFFKKLKYRILLIYQKHPLTKLNIFWYLNGILCTCVLIMSIIIVEVAAIAFYENRTPTLLTTTGKPFLCYQRTKGVNFNFTINSTAMTLMPCRSKESNNIGNHNLDAGMQHVVKRNIVGTYGDSYIESKEDTPIRNRKVSLNRQRQHEQLQWQTRSAIDNAYLFDRNNEDPYDQSGYGVWRTKVKKSKTIGSSTVKSQQQQQQQQQQPRQQKYSPFFTLSNATKRNANVFDYNTSPKLHTYYKSKERGPSNTKLLKSNLLSRRTPLFIDQNSNALQRQYNEVNILNNNETPKPFQIPSEGSLPAEFKKPDLNIGTSTNKGQGFNDERPILIRTLPSHTVTPTVLHISGSFNNFKLSGFMNFLRGKKEKPNPLWQQSSTVHSPLRTKGSFPKSVIALGNQPYKSLIMDQLHSFKPRSPYDINFMAIQQQNQEQKNPRIQNLKYKRLKKEAKNENMINANNLTFSQYSSASKYHDILYPSFYSPYNGANIMQAPQLANREPFKVKLDIIPMRSVPRNVRGLTAPNVMDNSFKPAIKLNLIPVLKNPIPHYITTPLPVLTSALDYYNSFCSKQPIYNPRILPTPVKDILNQITPDKTFVQQTVYPHQMSKYRQQERQQFLCNPNIMKQFAAYRPVDREQFSISANNNSHKTGPITVHLNIFSKQKPLSLTDLSNPLYLNAQEFQSNNEKNKSDAINPIKSLQPVSSNVLTEKLNIDRVDVEKLQQPLILSKNVSSPLLSFKAYHHSQSRNPIKVSDSSSSYNYLSGNLAGNRTENNLNGTYDWHRITRGNATSHFNFPIKDLIQFQVHDAI